MDFTFNEHEKRILSNIGHGAYGPEFIELMGKLRARLCSIEDIPSGGDHNAQVEARLIFKKFVDRLTEEMTITRRNAPPRPSPGPRGEHDFT